MPEFLADPNDYCRYCKGKRFIPYDELTGEPAGPCEYCGGTGKRSIVVLDKEETRDPV